MISGQRAEHRHRDADDEKLSALRTVKSGTPMRVWQQGKEPWQEWSEHLLGGGRPLPGNTIPRGAKEPATARIGFVEPQGMPGSNQVVPPIVRLLVPHFDGHPIHFR